MQPGYPVESVGDMRHQALTQWADGVPHLKAQLFGESLKTPETNRAILGFSCTDCGFIELYAVDEHAARYHATKS